MALIKQKPVCTKSHPVYKFDEIFPCNYFMKYCPAGHYCFLGFMGITKSMLNYFFKITKQNNRHPIKQKTYISKKSIIVVIK